MHVLGRAHYDRRLAGGGTIAERTRTWSCAGTRTLTLREREGRPERETKLELRFGSVAILRPDDAHEPGLPEQVSLSLIELLERDPPEGVEPIHWWLLTTHAITDAATAWQIADWYRARWIIEQLFRLLKKQGLRVEDSQIETADRLLKLVAIAARAAAITLQLLQARDGHSAEPASVTFSSEQLATLDALDKRYTGATHLQRNPHPHRSLRWAAWLIARLGGWDGYPSSRPPGPITFKNGIDRFLTMAEGWALRDVCMP